MKRVAAGVESLIADILRSAGPDGRPGPAPRLEGALCRNRHTLFDLEGVDHGQRQYIADEALDVCWRCPALTACSNWAARQHFPGFIGVVGGRVVGDARLDDTA